jgi:hypothetical protein
VWFAEGCDSGFDNAYRNLLFQRLNFGDEERRDSRFHKSRKTKNWIPAGMDIVRIFDRSRLEWMGPPNDYS